MEKIKEIIKICHDLMAEQDYEKLSKMMKELPPSTPAEDMIAYLRASFSARDKIDYWKDLLKKVQIKLNANGIDSKRMLHGLT